MAFGNSNLLMGMPGFFHPDGTVDSKKLIREDSNTVASQSGNYNSVNYELLIAVVHIHHYHGNIKFIKAKFFHCLEKLISNICVNLRNVFQLIPYVKLPAFIAS